MVDKQRDMRAMASSIGEDLLSLTEAAGVLGISKPTMYRLLEREAVRAFKVGNQWRFRKTDLAAYLNRGPVSVALSTAPSDLLDGEIAWFDAELAKLGVAQVVDEASALDPGEEKVAALIKRILVLAIESKASDIHLEPMREGIVLRLRVDGVLHIVRQLPSAAHASLIAHLKTLMALNVEEKRLPQDGRLHFTHENKQYDMRANLVPTVFGENAVMRILDQTSVLIGLDRLGLYPDDLERVERLITRPAGLVISSGPTGSGKTTTLYSCLNRVNRPEVKILTIEDPVEYLLPGINQVAVLRKAGLTFPVALRAFLRQDPDIIMCGEIRDLEMLEISNQAALTGHLVFSTLHADDTAGALIRMHDIGIEPFLLATSVAGVISQRLLRLLCPHCRQPQEMPAAMRAHLRARAAHGGCNLPEDVMFYRPVGCEQCHGRGYRGRMAIFEVLEMTPALKEAVLRNASHEEFTAIAVRDGMHTLLADGLRKAANGLTSVDEVLRVAPSVV